MPGRFFLTTPVADVAAKLEASRWPGSEESRRNIAPGQEILVCRDGVLSRMRWGMIPVGRVNARGRPAMETIVNARSETLFEKSAFEGVGRAVVPADGWYEWTGKARRKQPWRISRADGGLLLFAAITDVWQAPGGIRVDQVVTVTCEPSGDVRDIHDRMGVLLPRRSMETWLTGSEAEAKALCVPYPEGTLTVEKADDVDWDAS